MRSYRRLTSRLPDSAHDKLDATAARLGGSVNMVVNALIEGFADKLRPQDISGINGRNTSGLTRKPVSSSMLFIAPAYRDDPKVQDFSEMLAGECVWSIEDFGGDYPWDTDIPPRKKWASEIKALNKHLRSLSEKQ